MLARTLVVSAIYLLPVAVVCALRARDDRSVWEIAGDVPLAVSADLLLVLLLSRFMILEIAAIVSRGLWIAAAAGGLFGRRRRGRLAWPRVLDRGAAVQAVVLAAVALGISLTLSRNCAIWDREWHIPLVASLRGQRLPFMNVYGATGLYYHFTGDVLAAMLQAFSRDALHASLALSLAHDLVFTLLGAQLGLVLWAAGLRRLPLAVLVEVATLLAGPVTLLREPMRKLESGFSIVNLLSLSFRPHASLAILLVLGFLTFVLARLQRETDPVSLCRLWLPLAFSVAALALTDEASLALLGLGLGALWLSDPGILGVGRRAGALSLAALAAVVAVTIGLCVGAVGLHAPRHAFALVAPRAPGFLEAPVPFSQAGGPRFVAHDLLSILSVGGAGLALCFRSSRAARQAVMFYAVVLVLSALAFCCLEIDHAPVESHRWVTAAFVLAPVLAATWLVEVARARGSVSVAAGWPALVVYVGCGLGLASTVEWLGSGVADRQCHLYQGFEGFASSQFYSLDCRAWADARPRERTQATYVDPLGAYLYAGCRPTFLSGPPKSPHEVKVGRPQFGPAALADLQQNMLPAAATLPVVCSGGALARDQVCLAARNLGRCERRGSTFEVCGLSGPDRSRLLGIAPAGAP